MQLITPESLHYPITVTKLLRQPGDNIGAGDALFTYEYKSKVVEFDDERREDVERTRGLYSDFQSEYEGTISTLRVQKGTVIQRALIVADIDEACRHETQYGGICADCGQDMTTVQYHNTARNTDRATVNSAHSNTELRVSLAQASKADEEAKRRLLDSRKLSLVVDLDQTIIHATVDPTVAEWQRDPDNPNHAAVKDVRYFQLVDDAPGARGCWYYIKLRPGLEGFLEQISKHYELHIYTMGTRAYAAHIAAIIDPTRSIFGDRILSRDESGSLTAKNLKRLFPVDTKMVVIIDDRGDVWHWCPNLIKVVPYDFFVGIGDINSSFLPKRSELESRPVKPAVKETDAIDAASAEVPGTDLSSDGADPARSESSRANGATSAVDQLVSMAGNQDQGSIKVKSDEQDEAIAQQLADRPLLQKQKILDASEEEAKSLPAEDTAPESSAADDTDGVAVSEPAAPRYRQNLLQDDDNELEYLQQNLRKVHRLYFEEYDKASIGSKGGRIADIRGVQHKKRPVDDLENIPNAALLMQTLKSRVLSGVSIVFSGVIPMGVNIESHDLGIWAKTFGATLSYHIGKSTTHVIASPERRTAKVRQASKRGGRIQIVTQAWLYACFTQWEHVDEAPFRVHSDNRGQNGQAQALPDSFDSKDEQVLSSSDDEAALTEEDEPDTPAAGTLTPSGRSRRRKPAYGPDIDTDTEELRQYAPTTDRADLSPADDEEPDYWADIHDELEDFLASDSEADSSDADSSRPDTPDPTTSGGLRTPPTDPARKRKRDTEAGGAGGSSSIDSIDTDSGTESAAEAGGSRLQRRKRQALARTTSLTRISNAASPPSQIGDSATPPPPRPDNASSADPQNPAEGDADENVDADDDGFDLEAALAAEMDRQSDDEGALAASEGVGEGPSD